ncbi:response regulator transcription factor [Kitasatospora sp. GAS204B]|uniref:response regulator transcription factor n=1 Tax=unclassified Kitasatospora TaxID=2633591 RepID=UPI00247697E3|nr:response regulator transcription factor [Kitasatospora sp. GAS204B]MDH6119733.1 two-component system response regulator MprA [Kitasatospora sp. GAS204B]
MSAAPRVLVVDGDPAIRASLMHALAVEGYVVRGAPNGLTGLRESVTWQPRALVLGTSVATLDGLTVCRRLRALGSRLPILLLTSGDSVSDRVAGLDAGADDCLVEPFALAELTARLRALLRRTAAADPAHVYTFGDLTLDPDSRTGTRAGRALKFSRTEFTLLELLVLHPGQVLTRELIMDHVWGPDLAAHSSVLAVYIRYLRRKLEADGEPRLVHTVHGVGYRLDSN